jgi:DNA replication protein DnaC
VDSLIELVAVNAQREEEGKPLLDVVLNRIFLGNPGTGKTTVARIYGQLLAEMGLLSKGDVILKTASDFVGSVLGSSEGTTRDILRAAEGCVLVIDEAYGLYSGDSNVAGNNPYNTAVINTIVEQVRSYQCPCKSSETNPFVCCY